MTSASRQVMKHLPWFSAILMGFAMCTISFAQPIPSAPSLTSAKLLLVKDKEGNGPEKGKGKKDMGNKKGKEHKNPDKLRGLDRADEVAGEHGKQGRDNARAKQAR